MNFKPDVIKTILLLPYSVECEGATFELIIFKNGTNELRLAYELRYVIKVSKHYKHYMNSYTWKNPFENEKECTWLWLLENIENEADMLNAVNRTKIFLEEYKLSL